MPCCVLLFGLFLSVSLQILEHHGIGAGARVARTTALGRQYAGPLVGREVIGLGSGVAHRAGFGVAGLTLLPELVEVVREFGALHPTFGSGQIGRAHV